MNTDEILEQMIAKNWTEADLRLAARLLAELDQSEQARKAVQETDRLRSLLANPIPDVEPSGGWGEFERRLLAVRPAVSAATHQHPPRHTWFSAAALAASLTLAAVGWLLYWNQPRSPQPLSPQPVATSAPPRATATVERMTPNEVNQQVGLFDQVSKVFDDRTKWVAVSDGAADLGLASSPMPQGGKLLLLRLSVLRGGAVLSHSDLVIVPGQDAELTVPFEAGQRLHYRLSAATGEPTRVSLWVELQQRGMAGKTLAALATEVSAHTGDLVKAGELVTSSGQYQFQMGCYAAAQPPEEGR